ncbi:MAG TPA: hypothetical protein VE842_02195 [Pyrinomonadaceae bacterium]|jgi:hypothetical protein|nr:hypothetical protein [Pyrinomonadaceae bacterium]
MKIIKSKPSLLITIAVILAAVSCAYALQTQRPNKIKGVTVTSRRYEQKPDGTIVERGMQTTYISARGSWRTVKTAPNGNIEQLLVADPVRGGVFSIDTNKREAARLAGFTPKESSYFDADGYRNNPQFAGEETLLGFKGFIQRVTTPEGKVESELTFIPEFDTLPVKEVHYLADGSKRIVEPVSISVGEPTPSHFQLPSDFQTRDALLDQHTHEK